MVNVQKPISTIPIWILVFFAIGLSAQITWYQTQKNDVAIAVTLPISPQSGLLKISSLGEPEALSRMLMLWLQAFDNQPGISIPFASLNYDELEKWLLRIIELDPKSNYPLLAASRVYSEVPDPKKQRQMMELVYRLFLIDPAQRWPWLAHVTVIAKHRLKDDELALKFAHTLADSKLSNAVPAWVRQLEIVVLEDMGELESVRLLVGGLLQSQTIHDSKELIWLEKRLVKLESIPIDDVAH